MVEIGLKVWLKILIENKTKKMKYRVLFNLTTHYLSITTSDINDSNLVELFSSQADIETANHHHLCLNMCNVFCLGYLQGNDKTKAKNSPADFE